MVNRVTLKASVVVGLVGMVLGIAPSARADQELSAKVPFEFIVAGVRMPAGTYVFTQQEGQSLVSIESRDRRHFAFVLMNPMSSKDSKGAPTLVFDRIGADHLLAKVIAGGGDGRELVLTPVGIERTEQEAEQAVEPVR
jgi:hypothetical protein